MGRSVGFGYSTMGCLGHIPSSPGTLGWEGQGDLCTSMGHLGHVWDIPSSPGSLGWEGQRDFGTLAWDMSQVVLGLWDGKDSVIWALYHGTLGTCWDIPSSPGALG